MSTPLEELEEWERRAVRRVEKGKPPLCPERTLVVPTWTVCGVENELETDVTPEDVRATFRRARRRAGLP